MEICFLLRREKKEERLKEDGSLHVHTIVVKTILLLIKESTLYLWCINAIILCLISSCLKLFGQSKKREAATAASSIEKPIIHVFITDLLYCGNATAIFNFS